MTWQQKREAVGRKIWILFPSLLHSTHILGSMCVSLCNAVYKWKAVKSQGMLEIKGEKGRRVCGGFITRNSLNVAYPPGTKIEYFFFSQSISSTTDTLPNYGPFVYIEIKIIALKKCLPAAQDANIHHTP